MILSFTRKPHAYRDRLRRTIAAVATASVAAAVLVPGIASAAENNATSYTTAPVSADLVPIDVQVVKATGALRNAIVEGVENGLGRRGMYTLNGIEPSGSKPVTTNYTPDMIQSKQWKPKYGWDYATVLAESPDKI